MTAIGPHNELTAAIAENLKRRHTHTTEVVKEAMPADVAARLEALEQGIIEITAEAARQNALLAELLQTFSQHVHAPPAEMAELAQRVQALEMLARRAA